MIADISDISTTAHNGRHCRSTGDKKPERNCWELLGWAVLEQAVDDLANLCRWGIVTPAGKCMPWPFFAKKCGPYRVKALVKIAGMTGPNSHKELKAWFLSEDAKTFCDLIGCRLDPAEMFWQTVKHHAA